MRVADLQAWEILDSRGRPTVAARLTLTDGAIGTVSVPSGASTGKAEARELRDGGARFGGFGCKRAVANVQETIRSALLRESFDNQEQLDRRLLELDGSSDKSRLGANALLAVSLAFARAAATHHRIQLFEYFSSLLPAPSLRWPTLTVNLFSGGIHGFAQVSVQDVLLVPLSGQTMGERLAQIYAVYQQAAAISLERYRSRPLTADEGGLAPPFESSVAMLETAAEAIEAAGFGLGNDFALAIDVAASHFWNADGTYLLDGRSLSPENLIQTLSSWSTRWPIISVEDGLGEEDWNHWPVLCQELGERSLTLADDLTCTNPARIKRAIDSAAANALLLKVNQIGTLTEAKEALLLARAAGWSVSISARSGETEDNWLADLALGWGGDFLKVGSITQSERLAKYNRLLEIEFCDQCANAMLRTP
jgi:enolase